LLEGEFSIWIVGIGQVVAIVCLMRYKKRSSVRSAPGAHEHLSRAMLFIQQGQLSDAELALTQSLRLDPRNAGAYTCRGSIYHNTGRLDDALADLNYAILIAPKLVEAYVQRGHVHVKRKEYDDALADFDTAEQLATTRIPGPAIGRATVWMERENYDLAIDALGCAMDFASCRPAALCTRGLARLLKGDLDQALTDADEAVRLLPDDAVAYNNRGAVYLKRGDYAAAQFDLQRAIRLSPKHPNAYKNLAWLQATCPDHSFRNGADAEANAMRAWQLAEGKFVVWLEILAAAHAEAGHFEKAVDCQLRFIADCPTKATSAQRVRVEGYRAGRPFRDEPTRSHALTERAEEPAII
jgi:tetratricopeptide (TPR) repeat protein